MKFRPGLGPTRTDRAIQAIEDLGHQIPDVRSLRVERDSGVMSPSNYDIALFVDFDSPAGVTRFLEHPAHVALVEEHIRVVKDQSAVMQYAGA